MTQAEDLDMLALQLPRMRAELIDVLDRIVMFKGVEAPVQEFENRSWQIRREAYPILVKLFDHGMDVKPSEFGWSIEQLVSESLREWLCKSAETPELEATPHQLGPNGLWHTPSKKHPLKEKLPNYIEHVAHALMRDQGMGESQAIATAINAVKRWAKGDLHWGKGHVTPEVQAASKRALEAWAKLKEEHSG